MIRRIFSLFIAFVFFMSFFTGAQAAMVLDKMIVYFNANQSHEDVVVQNPDKEPLYLKTSIVEVFHPGTKEEKRVEITDPDKMNLLVSPQKVIIPPGGRKTIRMVSLSVPKDKEAVYRVNFTPVVGKVKATRTAVKILIGYQALVFVRPEKPYFQVTSHRKGDTVTFTNTGDVNVLLRNGKYCPKGKERCVEIKDGARLYAGESWTLTLPGVGDDKKDLKPNADASSSYVSDSKAEVKGAAKHHLSGASHDDGTVHFGLYDGKKEHDKTFSLSTKTTTSMEDVS